MSDVIEFRTNGLARDGFLRACRLADIVPNTGVCLLLGGQQVAVFRVGHGEQVYAVGNTDPFSGANVLSRGIVGDRAGRPKIASPIYKESFCLRTGVCLDDESVSIPVYEARVRNGIVEVREPVTRSLQAGNSGLLAEG